MSRQIAPAVADNTGLVDHWQAVDAAKQVMQYRKDAALYQRSGMHASADATRAKARTCENRVLAVAQRVCRK